MIAPSAARLVVRLVIRAKSVIVLLGVIPVPSLVEYVRESALGIPSVINMMFDELFAMLAAESC